MRETYSDGVVSLSIENNVGTIRFYPKETDTPYEAVCTFSSVSSSIVKISALIGKLTKRHMRLLVHVLFDKGYRVVYAQRHSDDGKVEHTLPYAVKIEGGDFDGWLRIDLTDVFNKLKGESE